MGKAVVYVTHDLELAEKADKWVKLQEYENLVQQRKVKYRKKAISAGMAFFFEKKKIFHCIFRRKVVELKKLTF